MRPLARRREMMARPPRVLMRARKPSLRARGRFLGCQVRFIVFIPPNGSSQIQLQGADVFDLFSNFASRKRARSITRQKSFANPLNSFALRFKIKRPVCTWSVLTHRRIFGVMLAPQFVTFLVAKLKLTGVTPKSLVTLRSYSPAS